MEKKATFVGNAYTCSNSEYDGPTKISRIPLFNSQASISVQAKSKSSLNTARSMVKQEKVTKQKSIVDGQSVKNFRFGSSPAQAVKKIYQKNSEKTIRPPDKFNKMNNESADGRWTMENAMRDDSTTSIISYGKVTRNKTMTDNFPLELAALTRVDTKTIIDLEKRVENLQSILLKKVELLKNRSPDTPHREYKFIALIEGEESKLLVKESDRKSFPKFLPAKSIEDLNRRASEFFIACLLSFVDKLRYYQDEGRSINCDELYEDLCNDEQEYCSILRDWVNDLCDYEEQTLVVCEKSSSDAIEQETQTETVQETLKMSVDEEVQTESISGENIKYDDVSGKIDRLRLENYELKEQLAVQKSHYVEEIESIERLYKDKISDLMDCWQNEKSTLNSREEVLIREQKMNTDLSQQAIELKNRLNDLMDKHEILLSQKSEEDKARSELQNCIIEIQRLEAENRDLKDLKSHFLKRLDQRYEQIELQEKEIKLQKRTNQKKSDEIEKLKNQYDAKVKENRQTKESLEARNKLIDHLRNAVEIDQKKIRELELLLENKQKEIADAIERQNEKAKETLPKTLRSRVTFIEQIKGVKKVTSFNDDTKMSTYDLPFESDSVYFDQQIDEGPRTVHKRTDRMRKKDFNLGKKDTIFDVKGFQGDLDSSIETGKIPTRNTKQNKRIRDIVVKKYDM